MDCKEVLKNLSLNLLEFISQCFMELHEKLVSAGFEIEALKMALLSQNEICIKEGFKVFENTDVSSLCYPYKAVAI